MFPFDLSMQIRESNLKKKESSDKWAKQASFTAVAGRDVCTVGSVERTEWNVEWGRFWLNFTNHMNDLWLHIGSKNLPGEGKEN